MPIAKLKLKFCYTKPTTAYLLQIERLFCTWLILKDDVNELRSFTHAHMYTCTHTCTYVYIVTCIIILCELLNHSVICF